MDTGIKLYEFGNQLTDLDIPDRLLNMQNEITLGKDYDHFIKLNHADHTVTSLMEDLQSKFAAQGITLQTPINGVWTNVEGKLLFSFTTPVNLFARHPLTGDYNPASHIFGITESNHFETMFTAQARPDLSMLSYIYLRSTAIAETQSLINGANRSSPVFAVIPVTVSNDTLVFNQSYPGQYQFTYQQPRNLSQIDIQVTDQIGTVLSEIEADVNILFEIVYES